MCEQCKSHYTKLREQGRQAASLEYKAGTYPMVFKCKTLVRTFTEAPTVESIEVVLKDVKKRLKKHYKKKKKEEFEVYIGGYHKLKGNLLTIYTDVLIDFPCKIDKDDDARIWALSYFPVEVKYKQPQHLHNGNSAGDTDPRDSKADQTVHLLWADWEIVYPRNEHHLCETRLEFFMKVDGPMSSTITREE